MDVEEFIEHYGVKGMHWGIRNKKSRVKSARRTLPSSHDSRKVEELRKRKKSQLTNKQLDAVNNRLNKEKNFQRLNPNSIEQGETFVKTLIGLAGTATAAYVALTKTETGKKIIAAGKKYVQVSIRTQFTNKNKIDVNRYKLHMQSTF